MITDHHLITITDRAAGGVTVKLIHRGTGLAASSDVHSHKPEAKAQAMERLEALLAQRDGEGAA